MAYFPYIHALKCPNLGKSMANRPYIEPRLLGEGRGAKRAAEWEHPVAMQQRLSSQLGWEAFFSNVFALAQCEAVPGQDIPLKNLL